MVNPERTMLQGIAEVDETTIDYRTKDEPVAGGRGRSHISKIAVIATVEIDDEGRPGRTRLEVLPDYRAESIGRFVRANIAAGATLVSDGLQAYRSLRVDYDHDRRVVGKMPAHIPLPWVR